MAAWALAEVHGRDFVDPLQSALHDDASDEVRETAAWALGELEVKRAADALAAATGSDKSTRVRGTAAWAIGQVNPGRAPRQLLMALHDADDDVRLKAAWALSQIRDTEVVPDLTAAMKAEKSDRVRQALVRALLQSGGERTADAFNEMLDAKDQQTREMAVRALAGHRGGWPWPWPWPRPRPNP